MTTYKTHLQVLSQHCDATGIVHFSRYAEMAETVVELWFDEAIDLSYAQMHGRENAAVLMVKAEMEFPAASRLGDHLVWRLSVRRLGQSSLDLSLVASSDGEKRGEMLVTLVFSQSGVIRPRPWPDAMRARVEDYVDGAPA